MKLRILIAGLLIGVAALAADNGAELFQKAVTQERAAGNLEEAIKLYQRVATEFASSDRALAAKALVAEARCYEKLGQDKADKATKLYEQVARDYRDQPDQSATARERLAALAVASKPKAGTGMTSHQIPIPSTAMSVYSDGRHVFYQDRAAGGLVAAKMDGSGQHLIFPLRGRSMAGQISVSPDGSQIAVKLVEPDHNSYCVVAADGSGFREIFRDPINGKLAVGGWSPDGTHFLGHIIEPDGSHTVAILSAVDGSVRKVKDTSVKGAWTLEGGGGLFSRDGKYVVFALLKEGTSQQSDIHVLAVDGSYGGKLVDHPSYNLPIDFTPDGRHLLFQSDRSGSAGIYALAVSNGRAQGEPMLLKQEAGIANIPGSIAKDGTLFYSMGEQNRPQIFTVGLDAALGTLAGAPQVFAGRTGMTAESGAWSPDGQRFAWLSGLHHNVIHDEGDTRLTIRGSSLGKPASGKDVEYEVPPATEAVVGWAADGREVYTARMYGARTPDVRAELHSILVENGADRLLAAIPGAQRIYSVRHAADGNALLIAYGGDPSNRARIAGLVRLDPQTGQQTEIVPKGVVSEITISPDGTQIAALDRQVNPEKLLVKPVVRDDWKTLAILEGTGYMFPHWMPNGSLIVGKEGSPNSTLFRISTSGGTLEKIGELPSLSHVHEIRVHPDGRQLMFQSYVTHTELWALENFLPKELAAR